MLKPQLDGFENQYTLYFYQKLFQGKEMNFNKNIYCQYSFRCSFMTFWTHSLLFSAYSLQALHIHNNHLAALPDEMVALRKLFILVLAFNHFTAIPAVVANMTDVRVSEVQHLITGRFSNLSKIVYSKYSKNSFGNCTLIINERTLC